MTPLVSLVGAGPGDPDLLTVRAVRTLAAAEVVFHDALIDARVLDLAPRAIKVYVGKRAGHHALKQESIHKLMVRAARRGKRVVRLKGGDLFVFGRGGEEAQALADAGIPYELVPGLSSALAGPQAMGVPVTFRGLASSFVVLTAQPELARQGVLDSLRPGAGTLVILMGLKARATIAAELIARGWSAATPMAAVIGAHTPQQWSWIGTLDTIDTLTIPADRAQLPGLLVVGDVVSLARTTYSEAAEVRYVHG